MINNNDNSNDDYRSSNYNYFFKNSDNGNINNRLHENKRSHIRPSTGNVRTQIKGQGQGQSTVDQNTVGYRTSLIYGAGEVTAIQTSSEFVKIRIFENRNLC